MSPDSKFEVVKFLERGFVPLEINALRYDLGERTRSNSLFNRITHCKNSCENSIRSRTINMQGTQGGAASNVCFGSDICFRIKCSPRLRKTLFRSPLPLKLCHPPYMIHEAHSIRRHPMARHSANHRPVKSCLVIR